MELVRNQGGFSLVQVLMSIGLMSVVGLGVTQLTMDSNKAVSKMEVDTDLLVVYRNIMSVLSSPTNCTVTFLGAVAQNQPNAVTQLKKEVKGVFVNEFATSQTFGSKQLKILSYSLSDASPEVDVLTKNTTHLVIEFDRGLGKVSSKIITKKIILNVQVDSANKITTCSAIGESGSEIWKFAANQKDVFYNNGNVGIGTNYPGSLLDVIFSFTGKTNVSAGFIGGMDTGYSDTGVYFVQKDNVSLGSTGTKLLNVVSNGSSRFSVDGTGRVEVTDNSTSPRILLNNTRPTLDESGALYFSKNGVNQWGLISDNIQNGS